MESLQGISEEKIREIIEKLVSDAVARFIRENEQRAKELSVIERVIRVEEELKSLREVQIAQTEAIERRFEAIDKRFEVMDRRFEALEREMDRRFEALERRFSFRQWFIGIGFSVIVILMSLFRFVH